MRLIDADILLDRVEWANTNPLLDHGKTAVELIKNAPTIEPEDRCGECDAWNQYKNYSRKSQWIPCSERLPEERKEVLASTIDGYLYVADYEIHNGNVYWEETTEYTVLDVLAWMPLPESYSGETELRD